MTNRIDWLRIVVYSALLLVMCAIVTAIGWLIEQFIAWAGPWVLAHAEPIAAVVLTVCFIMIVIMGIAEKNNSSW